MSESLCQNALFRWCDQKRHRHIVPNVQLFGWESDLVSVTKAGLICEYEIKCSRADFLNDRKKYRHRHLIDPHRDAITMQKIPAYFFYAIRSEVKVSTDDIPEYAGLLLIHGTSLITQIKPAPRLHKAGMTDHQRQWLERSIIQRYWRHRLKGFGNGTV